MRILATLVALLFVHTALGAVVCAESEYSGGAIQSALYGSRPYQFVNLDWMVEPPISVELQGGAAILSYREFAASYPWARDLLKRHSTLKRYTLGLVKLAPPGESPGCLAWVDSVDMYWDTRPRANMFTLYPVRCDHDGQLMFGVDPSAHPVKDDWGPKPRAPTDGKHFAPRGGRASFESMIARVNQGKPDYVSMSLAYHSGAEPRMVKLTARSCVDVDMPGLGTALVARYNETVPQSELRASSHGTLTKPSADSDTADGGEAADDAAPSFSSEAEKDRWVLDMLRKSGVRVDLPREGKLAPPPPPPSTDAPSPYEGNVIDEDAVVRPGDELGHVGELARVVGAEDANEAILDGRLWPVLECVKDANDGTCIAFFGYHLASDTAVDVPVRAEEDNWFDPQEFLTDFDRDQPTHFEPGYHEKAFVIRWVCDKLSGFKEIHWTLKGSTASATASSPDCGVAEEDGSLLDEARSTVERARGSSSIRKLFSLERDSSSPTLSSSSVTATTGNGEAQSLASLTTTADAATTTAASTTTTTSGANPHPPSHTHTSDCASASMCEGVLQPRLECTHNFENGTCVSFFGYLNAGNETIQRDATLPAGNFFTPIDEDQGQPSVFLPGRHYYAVTVYWQCDHSDATPMSVTWVLNTSATASSASHNTCEVGCDDVPFSNATDCPPSSSSSQLSSVLSSSSAAYVSSTSSGSYYYSSSSSTGGMSSSSSSSSSSSGGGSSSSDSTSSGGYSSSSSTNGMSSSSSSSYSSSTGAIPTPCPPVPACQYGASLELYRNRELTKPYHPPKDPPHSLAYNTQPYGLVKLEIPDDWLSDFCLDVTEVVECLCNVTTPCRALDRARPDTTGCNSPGVAKRVLYRESPIYASDGFAFVSGPPTYCSGARAFTWSQQMIAPPGSKLLVQAKWRYTTMNGKLHNCTGQSQGGSGAVYECCSCPATHSWNPSCGCCSPTTVIVGDGGNTTVNVNVTVINVINITVPDEGFAAASAIATATASLAAATTHSATAAAAATAATTTGNIVIVIDHSKPHWWGWLLIGIAAATAVPCLLFGVWFIGTLLPAPAVVEDYEMAIIEDEPPAGDFTFVNTTSYSGATIASRHELDIGAEYELINGDLVRKRQMHGGV